MDASFFFEKVHPYKVIYNSFGPREAYIVIQRIPKGSEVELDDHSKLIIARDVEVEQWGDRQRKYVRVLDANGNERNEGLLISKITHVRLHQIFGGSELE